MDDEKQLQLLKLELAAFLDIGKYFVSATYNLKGDGALALCCYEVLQTVAQSCRLDVAGMHMPNLRAVAADLASNFEDC